VDGEDRRGGEGEGEREEGRKKKKKNPRAVLSFLIELDESDWLISGGWRRQPISWGGDVISINDVISICDRPVVLR